MTVYYVDLAVLVIFSATITFYSKLHAFLQAYVMLIW